MSNVQVRQYLMYRKIVKKLLLVVGVWPIEKPNVFYRSLPYIQTAVSLFMAYFIFGFVQAHTDNINLIIRGLSIMTGFLTITLKMTCLILYRKEVYALHEMLDAYFKQLVANKDLIPIILENVSTFLYITICFIILVFYSCGFWILIPLYSNIHQIINNVQIPQFSLIYPTNYPWFLPKSGLIYHLHFSYECLATTILCFITSSVDSLFAFYIFQIIGQLRENSHCMSIVDENNNDGTLIKKCIIQYQNLMKCRDMMQKIFGPMILWIMGTNAVMLCTVTFQITHTKVISKARIGLLAAWFGLKLLQTFIYSWSGSQLTEESENYGIAVYCAKWYGNKSFMNSVIIMLTQRPLILTACHFSVVSVDIFVMILNTTVSYFFMLQALEDDA